MPNSPGSASSFADRVVERVATSLADGLAPALIYSNQRIHEAELKRLFSSAWVFIGHETEIPQPGDYCLRHIGDSSFIFVRPERGEVRLFFDACCHCGTQLCPADIGNAPHFRCPYYGWTYSNDGKLVGMPTMSSAYKGFERKDWGAIDEYFGDMKWYLDLVFGLGHVKVQSNLLLHGGCHGDSRDELIADERYDRLRRGDFGQQLWERTVFLDQTTRWTHNLAIFL